MAILFGAIILAAMGAVVGLGFLAFHVVGIIFVLGILLLVGIEHIENGRAMLYLGGIVLAFLLGRHLRR